ncbi:MAG TPA: hypothetical protein VD999_01625 [Vitreimonas sp.]|nr:hypothetical protein [Vitreimonas sp.]
MQLIRTTIRLRPQLKKAAEMKALKLNMTFQALLEKAIEAYLSQESRQQAQKLVFKARDLGTPLDQLDREAIYAD